MRGHFLAFGLLAVVVASTCAVVAEEAWWMPKPAEEEAKLSPPAIVGADRLIAPMVIDLGPPYMPKESVTANFGEGVDDCVITCEPDQRLEDLVHQLAFPIGGCTCETHGCAGPAAMMAMLPEAKQESTTDWPVPHKLIAGPLAYTSGCPFACDGAKCPRLCDASAAERLDHILEAVRHLEAAGLENEASRVRARADADVRAVMAELKAMKAKHVMTQVRSVGVDTTSAETTDGPCIKAASAEIDEPCECPEK